MILICTLRCSSSALLPSWIRKRIVPVLDFPTSQASAAFRRRTAGVSVRSYFTLLPPRWHPRRTSRPTEIPRHPLRARRPPATTLISRPLYSLHRRWNGMIASNGTELFGALRHVHSTSTRSASVYTIKTSGPPCREEQCTGPTLTRSLESENHEMSTLCT